ncbi:LysR family transcriptional regulator [Pelomonas sp. APW6]|uniref:LysR family transcriptional regulator n=1 Tax=Roseateles subflavus TaxID=3053353 RepID=A0ABT7LLP8_9BURK|nr:LysR family transcriptional regulator [Pelomonas sp. APW6]MDL5033085.1 LysR family transcriptional regulator [Pelomonas sp. APW6]
MNHALISHRHIEIFRALMLSGGVSEAARSLHTSQPTLSRELARLEYLLGYALFDRVRGRLKATQAALVLFEEVQRSYAGLDRIVQRARSLAQGQDSVLEVLSLPALTQALLPGACRRWQDLAPEGRVRITPQESPLLEEWLSEQRFDLGLTEQAQAPAGTRGELLFEADEVCVLPDGHPLLARAQLALDDLHDAAFISLASQDPYRLQLDALFEAAGVGRRLQLETPSAAAICECVRQGLGVSVLNPLTALSFSGRGLQLRRLTVSVPYRVYLVQPQLRSRHAQLPAFVQGLRRQADEVRQRLDTQLKEASGGGRGDSP